MTNKAICSKPSKFHQRAALGGPSTSRKLFRVSLGCFTPSVQAELDDFRKKKGKKTDGEAAKFQSRDHWRPARLQAASLGGFPCHSYPTWLHLLPALRCKRRRNSGKAGVVTAAGADREHWVLFWELRKPQPSTNIRESPTARTALRWGFSSVTAC